LMIW